MNEFNVIPSDYHIWNQYELEQFLISNQGTDISIIVNEGCDCEKIGLFKTLNLYKFRSVNISTLNNIQRSDYYNIIYHPERFRFFQTIPKTNQAYSQYHTWNQQQVFGMFYNRPIWHRIGLASYALTQHPTKTLLNFRYNPADIDDRAEFELDRLFTNDPKSLNLFSKCYYKFPIRLELQDGYTVGGTTQQHTDQLCKFYPNILIDVVAETFINGDLFFATEKTVRTMILKKPFIAMAARDHLVYLRQMGFKTFYEFWSEDYDGYEGRERYIRILDLIDFLSNKTVKELFEMYQSMQHILDHNYNLLLKGNFNTVIKQIYE